MKLGILVTSDKYLNHVIGIAKAASAKGHEVSLFAMDDGTRLMDASGLRQLCGVERLSMSLCRHSAEEKHVNIQDIPKEIIAGSQFNNAMMQNEADKVLVF